MERLLRGRSIVRMSVEVETPTLKPQQVLINPLSIEDIILKFKLQIVCNHVLVEENGDTLLVRQHESRKLPFVDHQLPVQNFDHSDDGALQDFLSLKFTTYGTNRVFDVKTITDEIINKWTMIKDEVANSSRFGKVFPLMVTLKLWNVVTRRERPSFMNVSEYRMVPTCDHAIEMLTRAKIEEVESDQRCVICLEDIEKEGECALLLLKMPCLHVFHEECIIRWLKTSHSCPICRFNMPTE